MSIHRLLQRAHFLEMSTATRNISIHNVLVLLRSYFPRHEGITHFYSQWGRCAALHHHIQSLRDKVVALKATELLDDDDRDLYTELIHDDSWCVALLENGICFHCV